MELRRATHVDETAIVALDPIAQKEASRVEFIHRSLRDATCLLAIEGNAVIGYGVLDYSFFGQGYISMLFVHPDHRRRRIATELMSALEAYCTTRKLFTSTNRSNGPMQRLLTRLGYSPSGIIENLDEGDPGLVYFKLVAPQSA